MDFDFTDDQRDIKSTARDLLGKRSSFERVRQAAEAGRYDDALWNELAELGWPGIAVSEEHGGQGLGTLELVILLEELGYACAVTPSLGSALAALVIDAAGSQEQRAAWLPRLASGEARGAIGTAELVVDGPGADVVVVLDNGSASLLEQPEIEALDTIDPTRRYGRVSGDGDALAGDVARGLDRAAIAVAAELVGVSQRALDMTVAYAKERQQFGRPIGAYQAVSHKAAEMLLHTEGARSATYFAAWAADAEPSRLPLAAAMAKAAASDGVRQTTGLGIQLHGGIGFTWEADLHWLFKRAQVGAQLLGSGGEHRARVAALAASREPVGA